MSIKERLLAELKSNADSRGRLKITLSALAKRLGLNAHDLQKNLFQLQGEHLVRLRSGRGPGEAGYEIKRVQLAFGQIVEQRLDDDAPAKMGDHPTFRSITGPTRRVHGVGRDVLDPRNHGPEAEGGPVTVSFGGHPRGGGKEVKQRKARKSILRLVPGSYPARILAVLQAMRPDVTGWIDVDPPMLQQRLGLSSANVATALYNLEAQGVIERLREGKRTLGVRLVPAVAIPAAPPVLPVAPEPEDEAPAEAEASPRILEELDVPATPLLDAYVAAKKAAEANPNWLRFEPDPLAEEALRLRAAVTRLYLKRYE